MTVVKRIENDCVICSIANACGYTYEQVYSKLTPKMAKDLSVRGLDLPQIYELLDSLAVRILNRPGRVFNQDYKVCADGNRALILLEKGEVRHMVAWDGFKIVESCKPYAGRHTPAAWERIVGGGTVSCIILKTNRSHRKASLKKSKE